MGADLAVILAPALDVNASVRQSVKPRGDLAFAAEAAVEALDV
jgi:hypothetical protein